MVSEPLAEEADGEPVEVVCVGGYSLASVVGEADAEEAAFNTANGVFELVDFVLDNIKDNVWQGGTQTSLTNGPLAYNMDESFLEDDLGASEVSQAQVGDGVLGDLLPQAGLELQHVVVDTGANDGEGIVLVSEGQQALALDVGVGDVDAVQDRRVVVEDAEEVVVVAEEVLVGLGQWRRLRLVGGEAQVGDGAEEVAR